MSVVVDDPADLTAEWVTAALQSQGHDVKLRAVSYERIGTGQMGASYRLHLDHERPSEVPATLVAKLAAGSPDARARVNQGYRKEIRFYSDLAPLLDVQIPECWYAAISEDLFTFTLLLADLAPAVPGVQANGCRLHEATAAVRNLAGLHAPLWCDPLLDQHADWLTPSTPESGAFLGQLMVSATEEFVDCYSSKLSADDVETLRRVAAVTGAWAGAKRDIVAVTHGDYRLDNLMFGVDGPQVTAIDWQTTSSGPPVRDLAYFLGTSLTTPLRREHERELVQTYVDALAERGVTHPFERCFEDYRLGFLQGPMTTVLGRIYATATPSEAADGMFLAMATRSLAAIRELNTLELLEG